MKTGMYLGDLRIYFSIHFFFFKFGVLKSQIFLYSQIVNNKYLSIWGVFAHVESEQICNFGILGQ